jgi:hypothetical protein
MAAKITRNLLILLLVALPLWGTALELQAVVYPLQWMKGTMHPFPAALWQEVLPAILWECTLLFPVVLLAGIIHQALLWGLSERRRPARRRVAAAASSLVVPATLLVVEQRVFLHTWRAAFPLLVLTFVYGMSVAPLTRTTDRLKA